MDLVASQIRISLRPDGVLRIHDRVRNILHELYPFQWNEVDRDGVSTVVQSMISRFEERDVFKILRRLESLDSEGKVNWNLTYNYLCLHYLKANR